MRESGTRRVILKSSAAEHPTLYLRGILFADQLERMAELKLPTSLRVLYSELVKAYLEDPRLDLKDRLAFGPNRNSLILLNSRKVGLIGRQSGTLHKQSLKEREQDPVIPRLCKGQKFHIYDLKDITLGTNNSQATQAMVLSMLLNLYLHCHQEVVQQRVLSEIRLTEAELRQLNQKFRLKISAANLEDTLRVFSSPSRHNADGKLACKIAYWEERAGQKTLCFNTQLTEDFARLNGFSLGQNERMQLLEGLDAQISAYQHQNYLLQKRLSELRKALDAGQLEEVAAQLQRTEQDAHELKSILRLILNPVQDFLKQS